MQPTKHKPSQGPAGLTVRQLKFCTEYMRSGNGSAAARKAGYSIKAAGVEAHRLLKNDKILAYIESAWKSKAMSGQEIIGRFCDQARADVSEFITPSGNVSMRMVKAKGYLLRKVRRTAKGDLEIETHDPQAALAHLAKIEGLFRDNVELSGKGGGPIPLTLLHNPTSITGQG